MGRKLNVAVSVRLSEGEVDAIASSLMRFERMRSIPGLVLIGALALLALIALPPVAAGAAVLGFVLMGGLVFSWLRRAQEAKVSAQAFTQQSTVAASERGLVVTRGTSTSELVWTEVVHATRTKGGWIFVGKKGEDAVLLPVRALTDAQAGWLTNLLSEWPARKYRRSPW